MQAEAAIEDGQEIASGRLFDQDGGNIALVAASPEPRDFEAAPAYRWRAVVLAAGHAIEPGRQDRRLAAPVAQVRGAEPSQDRVAGDSREDGSQPVLLDPESQPPLESILRLLEDQDLEAVGNAAQIGGRGLRG